MDPAVFFLLRMQPPQQDRAAAAVSRRSRDPPPIRPLHQGTPPPIYTPPLTPFCPFLTPKPLSLAVYCSLEPSAATAPLSLYRIA